jgi:hypothetical protein
LFDGASKAVFKNDSTSSLPPSGLFSKDNIPTNNLFSANNSEKKPTENTTKPAEPSMDIAGRFKKKEKDDEKEPAKETTKANMFA